ncbi:MAG: MFS transporter [Candidatus Lumbricidophila eiseniae]|uniref:MFS transporter n=1 Tax=Candidatus Lumbricidiphila eiseniae TaxID=1969409 RepID=A0A2A6FNL3_9MICO|nr:MAG: MFS transporter [Candidatus Lumbricidophila eiseniae]
MGEGYAVSVTPASLRPWHLWLVWGVAVAAYLLSVTNRNSLAAVGTDAASRFHADASTLSLIAVVQLFIFSAMQIPVGLLLDRFGARPIIVTGMIVLSMGQLTMAFSENTPTALIARLLLGAGDAAIFPSALRVISTWFPAQRTPVMVQLTGIVGSIGQLVAVLPFASLLHATGWTIAFGSLAGLGTLFSILMFGVIRNHPPDRDRDVAINTATGAIKVVRSAADVRRGFRESWMHPATRLAFWSHFTAPFSGSAFAMLWGFPFLTIGEGLPPGAASLILAAFTLCGVAFGPLVGALSTRHPLNRSRMLVLPIILIQVIAWIPVLLWPTRTPIPLLILLAIAMSTGGPGSMIGFDHARTYNPSYRLSTATGIVNVGGFLATLLAILFIGLAMDLQGASTPAQYSMDTFRVAFLTQFPLWTLGVTMIIIERRRTRIHVGLQKPKRSTPRNPTP